MSNFKNKPWILAGIVRHNIRREICFVVIGCGHTWDLTLVKGFKLDLTRSRWFPNRNVSLKWWAWGQVIILTTFHECFIFHLVTWLSVHHAFTENCAAADTASIPLFSRPNISGPCWITSWPWLSEKPPSGITKLLRNGGTLKWKEHAGFLKKACQPKSMFRQ